MVSKEDLDLVLRRLFALKAPKVLGENRLSHNVIGFQVQCIFVDV